MQLTKASDVLVLSGDNPKLSALVIRTEIQPVRHRLLVSNDVAALHGSEDSALFALWTANTSNYSAADH